MSTRARSMLRCIWCSIAVLICSENDTVSYPLISVYSSTDSCFVCVGSADLYSCSCSGHSFSSPCSYSCSSDPSCCRHRHRLMPPPTSSTPAGGPRGAHPQ